MALYSFIQFIAVLFLYGLSSNLSDNQYLFQDLFIIVPLAVTISLAKPPKILSKVRPIETILWWPVISSIIGHNLISAVFTISGVFILKAQSSFYFLF